MSFEAMVYRISPTLKRITKKLNGTHSYFDDEDLYQEALMNLWSHYKKGSLIDKTDSYILQGCYFHLRNHLRKSAEKVSLISLHEPLNKEGPALEELIMAENTVSSENADSMIDIDTMEQKLLTGRERQVLEFSMGGMTMREIGSKLGISHVMVLKIKNRIREKYLKYFCQ